MDERIALHWVGFDLRKVGMVSRIAFIYSACVVLFDFVLFWFLSFCIHSYNRQTPFFCTKRRREGDSRALGVSRAALLGGKYSKTKQACRTRNSRAKAANSVLDKGYDPSTVIHHSHNM